MTAPLELTAKNADFPASNFPEYQKRTGSGFPIAVLLYDATTDESAFWQIPIKDYVSGSLTIDIEWYAVNASSGTIVWEAQIAAITPNTDTQDVETKSLATLNYVQDTHLGTTGKRLHRCTITLSNLDSLADLDAAWLRIARDADSTNATDNMANDAAFVRALVY